MAFIPLCSENRKEVHPLHITLYWRYRQNTIMEKQNEYMYIYLLKSKFLGNYKDEKVGCDSYRWGSVLNNTSSKSAY
uniref:Ovule protein n=1 Tax=Strongyloides venezuelensis TaxID=75913 RepID=A0A0K0FVF2_STRVS